jgi:hypothetical protein
MLFFAAAAAVIAVITLQYFLYKKHCFDNVVYRAFFSSDEVYTGDDVYLYEELRNNGRLPLPYIRIETDLPDGLMFTLLEDSSAGTVRSSEKSEEKGTGRLRARYEKAVHSTFVLRPNSKITRRWRVICGRRGDYALEGVTATATDILGYLITSKRIEPEEGVRNKLTVLPLPGELDGKYASSRYICGDAISHTCTVTDPVRICGSREYTASDPMNRINWKSTAVHGKLMVNIEEKTVRHRYSVMLNMNSREIEQFPDRPSDPPSVEKCIVLCASILDRIAREDLPVSFFVNSEPEPGTGKEAVSDDETGCRITAAGPFRGKSDMVYALRLLAGLDMTISVPADRMFDHVAAHPELYSSNENLIIVSPYFDSRMLNLGKAMSERGVHVIYYISTSRNSVGQIPSDADVYFRL